MSIIRALREESETIKFDNLFSNDLENEREFDLIFSAEQDDEDLKSIAGNAILKEDGNEKEFNLPDCVYVNNFLNHLKLLMKNYHYYIILFFQFLKM